MVPRLPGFDLEWRAEPLTGLAAVRGLPLQGVELLERTGKDAAAGNVDVSFVFPDARVTVFNALDENGLGFGPPGAPLLSGGPRHEKDGAGCPLPAPSGAECHSRRGPLWGAEAGASGSGLR